MSRVRSLVNGARLISVSRHCEQRKSVSSVNASNCFISVSRTLVCAL